MTRDEKRLLLQNRLCAQGVAADGDAAEKLLVYQELLQLWNERLNLTGDASFEALLDAHLMDSLTPLALDGLLPQGATLIDVGTGAGFPGIPLAVARPDLKITLLDSQNKRLTFLEEVIRALGLSSAVTLHARAEDAARDVRYRERFSVAVARAVAPLPVLMELLLAFVSPGGISIAYKGPSVEEELAAGQAAALLVGGGPLLRVPVTVQHLPDHRHCLVICGKHKKTPAQYPRKAGIPAKNPLGME